MSHRWHFFRAGGVDQVSLRDGRDLIALRELDPQLWVALAMPTTGTDVDPETLALLDPDKDGRIRIDDIRAAIDWVAATFREPGDLLTSADSVALAAISDATVVAAARRMLADLGKRDQATISIADATAIEAAFATTVLNGDGIVIPTSTDDPELSRIISDAIACGGGAVDRSGKLGIDKPRADAFFADIDLQARWLVDGHSLAGLAAAADAVAAVRAKLDDYFTRCTIAAFDSRGAASLDAQAGDLLALNPHDLTPANPDLAKLPLARIDPDGRLPLRALNPAWAARIATFVEVAVTPLVGPRDSLTTADLTRVVDQLAAFETWRATKPPTSVAALEPAWVEQLAAAGDLRTKLDALILADAALAAEYDQIASVARAVRFQRDLGRIVRNFVNFSDFYAKQDGVFQTGTLYLDARALHLCVPVIDGAKHAALAGASDACLVYCEIKRGAETRQVAAAVTNGDADNIFVGRNGIFYDRKGQDWDATVTKIIANPISIRDAFWSPYKKLVKVIEDGVTKRAQVADAEAAARLEALAKDEPGVAVATVPAPVERKPIDLGTVAAIGVAIGGIGTLFGAVLGTMFGLGPWLPIGVVVLTLMISTPAMLLAWLKLRRRNLGPILDANGWAINGRARINVAFGAAMTELAILPPYSQRSLDDPFADKRTPWKRYVALVFVFVLASSWYLGKLDAYLPEAIRSIEILGKHAPAYRQPAPAPKT